MGRVGSKVRAALPWAGPLAIAFAISGAMAGDAVIERLAYRPDEAARALGCSRDTIFRLLGSGALRSYRVGTARFIAADTLKDFIAAREAAEAD